MEANKTKGSGPITIYLKHRGTASPTSYDFTATGNETKIEVRLPNTDDWSLATSVTSLTEVSVYWNILSNFIFYPTKIG